MAKQAGLDEAQRQRCWEHYIRGWRPGEIASELGLSEPVVRNALKTAQDAAKARRADLAADYLQRELDHLDALERTLEADLDAEDVLDDKGRVTVTGASKRSAAVRLLLEIKARRAKYLGLDKPAEVRTTITLEDLVAGSRSGD
jgi:DNA-binding CsgD family transcriptional regulator